LTEITRTLRCNKNLTGLDNEHTICIKSFINIFVVVLVSKVQ